MIVALVIALLVAAGFAVQAQHVRSLNEAFEQVAAKFNGEFSKAAMFDRPSLRFTHQGVGVLLDTFSTGGKHPTHYTQLHLGLPDRKLRLEVFPERFLNQLGKFFGTQDIELGSAAFDRYYVIRGNSEARIRELLTPAVQLRIDTLRKFLGNDDIYIGVTAGTLLIKKREFIRIASSLEKFIARGLALYDEIAAIESQGIEFVEQAVPCSETAVCQICGDEVSSAGAVHCKACKTPHHLDCWAYYGACSTYGCGEKKYRHAQAKRNSESVPLRR